MSRADQNLAPGLEPLGAETMRGVVGSRYIGPGPLQKLTKLGAGASECTCSRCFDNTSGEVEEKNNCG